MRAALRSRLASYVPVRHVVPDFAEAAVLVPVVERAYGLALVFTQRPVEMPTHGGQISFPGGRRHLTDASLRDCALREAFEEIGLDAGSVELLGELDDEITPLGFVITPTIGWLGNAAPFRPDSREVAEVFEVPIARLKDPSIFIDRGTRELAGRVYSLPEYHVDGRIIWGATARIILRLLTLAGLA